MAQPPSMAPSPSGFVRPGASPVREDPPVPSRAVRAALDEYQKASENGYARSRAEVERFFEGLDLVPPNAKAVPGVCLVGEWGAEDPGEADGDGSRWSYCGVARAG